MPLDLICVQVLGVSDFFNAHTLWSDGDRVPFFHNQQRIVVEAGAMTVFEADN